MLYNINQIFNLSGLELEDFQKCGNKWG
jgi:hypothetical protein